MRGVAAVVAGLVVVGSLSTPAAAEEAGNLHYDWKVDGAVTALAIGVWGGTELLRNQLAPSACRWCSVDGVDASVRDALRWNDPSAATLASNLTAFGVVPLASAGALALVARGDGRLGEMGGNGLIIAEAVSLAGALSQITKFAVGRERPYVHALPASDKPLTSTPVTNNLSFYSGHASFSFALATASGTVASLQRYRFAPVVWVTGLAAAAAVGYFRIAGDQHYLTDALMGSAVGSAVGFIVPYGFHRTHGAVSVAPAPGGGSELVLTGRW